MREPGLGIPHKGTAMNLSDFLAPQNVFSDVRLSSKKACLQALSAKIAKTTDLDELQVFAALIDRERLGSTGVGHGVAIPHARLEGLTHVMGVFMRLHSPIDFQSVDDQPVDLVFGLLAPEGSGVEHLKALSRVSRVLRDQATCDKIRAADTTDALCALLIGPEAVAA